MCDVTLDDEGTADAKQVNHRNEDEIKCQPKPANISSTSPGRILMQQNSNTCSVEIHVNPDVEDSDKNKIHAGESTKL